MFTGSMVALVTPFKGGEVDFESLEKLIEFQIENGTRAIVPCGSTGESATLSHAEHKQIIKRTVEVVRGRVLVLAGTGSNSTAETVDLTAYAKEAGVDGALLITPYYNKPTQEGMYVHYKKVADEVAIPIVLYNVPGRTGINLLPETVVRLAELKNIVGIKEASGNLSQMCEIVRLCGDKIKLISGDDNLLLPILSIGGVGVISVVANIIPEDVQSLIDKFTNGDLEGAKGQFFRMLPLCQAMFLESNPIPVKAACRLLDMCSGELRLPLTSISSPNEKKLKEALVDYNLL